MNRQELSRTAEKFSRSLRSQWQLIFLIGLLPYLISLSHFFFSRPGVKPAMLPYLGNLDLISFMIAIGIAVVILNLKRIYFSRRFIRRTSESQTTQDVEAALQQVFSILRKKMQLVWVLGAALMVEGAVFYWLTYVSGNMNVYFVIGAFSMALNYPRKELFEDIPWYVVEAVKQQPANVSETG